ncbi:MAG: dipeptidyl aminopeptidase/acylaminoacyl peptidase, partial [Lentisphaeria bacterium]
MFYVARWAIVACLYFFVSTVMVQLHAKPSFVEYAANTELQHVAVSPSGNRLVFRENKNSKDLIRVIDLVARKTLAAFDVSDVNPKHIYFIDEDKIIIKASGEKRKVSGFRDKFAVSSAFVYSVSTNKFRQLLTPGEVIYRGQTGLGNIVAVTEDKNYAYIPAFVQESNRFATRPPEYMLMKVSLGTDNARPTIATKGVKNAIDYFVGQDGEIIAVESYNPRSHSYRIRARDGHKWREIYFDDSEIREFGISGITADRKHLVLVKEDEDTGFESVYKMSLADGKISDKLFSHEQKDIDYLLTDINRVVHGVRYSGFTPTYEFFDSTLTERIADIQSLFKGESVFLTSRSPDWRHLIVNVTGSAFSGDFFKISGQQAPIFIGAQRPTFNSETLHPIIATSYKARDGMKIPLLVTAPRHKQSELQNLPAIMLPHGGPESHDKVAFDWLA